VIVQNPFIFKGLRRSKPARLTPSLVARQTKPDGCDFDDGFLSQASDGRISGRLDAFSQLRRCSSDMNPDSLLPHAMHLNRRKFLTRTAAAASAAAILPSTAFGETTRRAAPNRRITVAGIGLGPRGRNLLQSFLAQPDVQFVAIADVQQANREIIRRTTNRHYGNEDCASYSDMAEVLGRDDIDDEANALRSRPRREPFTV